MDIILSRMYMMDGTLSKIDFGNGFILDGIERTKDDKDHPCVPEARYTLEPHTTTKFTMPIWAMVNESVGVSHEPKGNNRFACLFGHVGNYAYDVEGCVALGLAWELTPCMVLHSKDAVQQFQSWMQKNWTPDVGLVINELKTGK